jgi:plasmid maintenance system antidote protein VapI
VTPTELREAGVRLYGKWGWQTRLAEALHVDSSTVRRWISGAVPISTTVEFAVKHLLDVRKLLYGKDE